MVKLFHHVLFSGVLEQVNDQEMRDGKSNHTIKDSCYHEEKGAEKTWGWRGDGSKHVKGTINHQLHKFTPLGLVSFVTVMYLVPRGERENGGV